MVTKNSLNFSSCDVTQNLGAEKVGNTLFLGQYFQENKISGRTGIPKEDATENIFHIKRQKVGMEPIQIKQNNFIKT